MNCALDEERHQRVDQPRRLAERDVLAADLQVARSEPRTKLEETDEPTWELTSEVQDVFEPELTPELPAERNGDPIEAPMPAALAEASLPPPSGSIERELDELPLEPLVPQAEPEAPVEVNEPSEPVETPDEAADESSAEPIDETLVVGVQETEPVLIDGPAPRYPPLALRRGWEGTTVVRIVVQPDGRVSRVEVDQSSGFELLDDAALEAIRSWRFQPGTRGGLVSESEILHRVRFRLVDAQRR